MKLALCLAALIGPTLLAIPHDTDRAPEERWRPLGTWEPHWQHMHPPKERPTTLWMRLPTPVAEVAESRWLADDVLVRASSAALPEGLELWILEIDVAQPHQANSWMMLVHDPESDRVSPRPAFATKQWIWKEEFLVRFCDLDDDGRNEFSIRQFDHNGTMVNADMLEYYTILPDLSLRMDLRQRTDLVDLWSEQEWGSIRSQLMLSTNGRLRCIVWRENPRHGVPRTPHGWLDLARCEEGYFEITDQANQLGAGEREQRYDWTIEGAAIHPKAREARKVR